MVLKNTSIPFKLCIIRGNLYRMMETSRSRTMEFCKHPLNAQRRQIQAFNREERGGESQRGTKSVRCHSILNHKTFFFRVQFHWNSMCDCVGNYVISYANVTSICLASTVTNCVCYCHFFFFCFCVGVIEIKFGIFPLLPMHTLFLFLAVALTLRSCVFFKLLLLYQSSVVQTIYSSIFFYFLGS